MAAQITIPINTFSHHRWKKQDILWQPRFKHYLSTNLPFQKILERKLQPKKVSYIEINVDKLKLIPLKSALSTLSISIEYSTWSYSKRNKTKEEIKEIQIGKEQGKFPLFANDMIVCQILWPKKVLSGNSYSW